MSGIDIAVVDSLKVLDPKWPIREADIARCSWYVSNVPTTDQTALLVSVSVERVSVCCLLLLGVGESRFEHFANRLPRAAVELN